MWDDTINDANRYLAIDGRINLAVLIDVEVAGTPSLWGRLIAGFPENTGFAPADRAAEDAITIQRFIFVGGKLNVVCIETRVDLFKPARRRIEKLNLTKTARPRGKAGGRVRSAKTRLIFRHTEARRHPYASLAVHCGMIRDCRIVPVELAAPVGRRKRHRLRLAGGRLRIKHGDTEFRRSMLGRFDHQERIVSPIDAVDQPI